MNIPHKLAFFLPSLLCTTLHFSSYPFTILLDAFHFTTLHLCGLGYRRVGKTCRSHLQGSSSPGKSWADMFSRNVGNSTTSHDTPEGRRLRLLWDGSLKSRVLLTVCWYRPAFPNCAPRIAVVPSEGLGDVRMLPVGVQLNLVVCWDSAASLCSCLPRDFEGAGVGSTDGGISLTAQPDVSQTGGR
jgi:hypothetical protein